MYGLRLRLWPVGVLNSGNFVDFNLCISYSRVRVVKFSVSYDGLALEIFNGDSKYVHASVVGITRKLATLSSV